LRNTTRRGSEEKSLSHLTRKEPDVHEILSQSDIFTAIRAMLCSRARYCCSKLGVCLSVCLSVYLSVRPSQWCASVTSRYRDHRGWISSKISSRSVSSLQTIWICTSHASPFQTEGRTNGQTATHNEVVCYMAEEHVYRSVVLCLTQL